MSPATWPRPEARLERLLRVDRGSGEMADARIEDLPSLLRAGDLLVVNDAATLPASLRVTTASGKPLEARLAGETPAGRWRVVLLGDGDWHLATTERAEPERVAAGDSLDFGNGLSARVEAVSPISPRLVEVRFDRDGETLWSALYRMGRPIQYWYTEAPLELWHVQTRYGGRPWAVELPAAGRPLTWRLLSELKAHGVGLAWLTHAAGISATGDPALDAALPFSERYEIPKATVDAVRRTRAAGGRVVAAGTSVVRALEGSAAANGGELAAGTGWTDLVLGPEHALRVVDGLLTGLHDPEASHYALLRAFATEPVLAAAYSHAEEEGYLAHEFGDSSLIL